MNLPFATAPLRALASVRRNPTLSFWGSLTGAAVLMLIGHWAVMASGAYFDVKNKTRYEPMSRWVSDFASKWPEGLLIKASLILFCTALALFFAETIAHFCRGRYGGVWKFWWLLVATAMIGGLLLVILFDMSAPQYVFKGPSFLGQFFGSGGEYVEVQRSQIDWVIRGHHQLGFQLFVSGFFAAALSLGAAEWRRGIREAIPTTLFLLLLAALFSFWLFCTQTTIAGVPQRALLLLIVVWMVRNQPSLRRLGS